jgi:hypothetical protein
MQKYEWEIISQEGNHVSYHKTWESAEKQRQRNLSWHCGICGNHREGWGRCSHGRNNWVCSALHYNDKIIHTA